MKNIKLKAVAVGILIDIVGSTLVGILIGAFIGIIGKTSGDASMAHLKALQTSIPLKLLGLLGTTFFTGLGGYFAARLSPPNGFSNSLAVGIVSLMLGIVLSVILPGVTPPWKVIIGLILTIPAAVIGGRIANLKK